MDSVDKAYSEIKINHKEIRDLKNALSIGKLKLVLEKLLKVKTLDDDQRNEIIIQLTKYNQLEKNHRIGVEENYSLKMNKIYYTVLQTIDSIKANFL